MALRPNPKANHHINKLLCCSEPYLPTLSQLRSNSDGGRWMRALSFYLRLSQLAKSFVMFLYFCIPLHFIIICGQNSVVGPRILPRRVSFFPTLTLSSFSPIYRFSIRHTHGDTPCLEYSAPGRSQVARPSLPWSSSTVVTCSNR